MNKLAIPLALVIGAAIGAGGYFAASRLCAPEEPDPTAEALEKVSGDLAAVRKGLGDLQERTARLEAEPTLQKSLNDPAFRDQLAALLEQTRKPVSFDPRLETVQRPGWRGDVAKRCRTSYARLLEDARKVLKVTDEQYRYVLPIFEKHFAPLEAQLKDLESGKLRTVPNIHKVLAPGLAETLAGLKKVLPAESYEAFEKWRLDTKASPMWGSSKGDFFLSDAEYAGFKVERALKMHWPVLAGDLKAFYAAAGVEEDKRAGTDALFKAHLGKVLNSMRDERRLNIYHSTFIARARAAMADVEKELGKLLGARALEEFRKWKVSPGLRSSPYLGERVKRPVPTKRPTLDGPGPTIKPKPTEKF